MVAAAFLAASLSGLAAPPELDGVWGATRYFGPAVRGTLEISGSGLAARARIAQFDVRANINGDRVDTWLPAEQGKFVGRFEQDRALIRGHWIQARHTNDGTNYASPVILRANAAKTRWTGEVRPYEDESTMYLVFSEGGTQAFIRNPDRNMGVFWRVGRVERDGDRVKLVGKLLGRGEDRVLGEGTYRAADRLLTMYFPLRRVSYDFRPVGNAEAGFHARPARERDYEYRPPPATGDGWKTGTLAEVGLDPAPIKEFVALASADPKSVDDLDLHGLLIARHGKLVVEEYFHGYHRMKPHETRSAGKTLATMLVGAQMQRGARLSPATRVYDLLPGWENDERKRSMTLAHLLTMASGYDCDDWDGTRPGSEDRILDDPTDEDYYRYTLRLPLEMAPGTQAVYCSINPNLVGAVVSEATGRPVLELFDESVARPLQFDNYHLNLQPTGEPYLGGGAKLRPRDFMKFGQVMLEGGTWNGTRIIPQAFARAAGSPLVTLRKQREGMRYGYLWWTVDYPFKGRTITAYFASGNGGNVVVVVPDADMVIACFGGNYNSRAGWAVVTEHIPRYILAAVRDPAR